MIRGERKRAGLGEAAAGLPTAADETNGEVFADDLVFPECPRWHDGQLWASDMWGHRVYRFDVDTGAKEIVHEFEDEPGGLGWLPDGRLLVVSMERRLVLRLEDATAAASPTAVAGAGDRDGDRGRYTPVVHADLTDLSPWSLNDMIVADDGTAYVSQFGFDLWGGTTPVAPAPVIRVTADGEVSVAADDLMCPNGMALTDDGRTLLVAEPAASRIARFEVAPDGTLTNGNLFAEIPPKPGLGFAPPDGICLDADGAVWMAEPMGKRVLRVAEGGDVLDEIAFDFHPTAVVLGGPDRRTLYVCLAPHIDHGAPRDDPRSRLDAVQINVPGAGRP